MNDLEKQQRMIKELNELGLTLQGLSEYKPFHENCPLCEDHAEAKNRKVLSYAAQLLAQALVEILK